MNFHMDYSQGINDYVSVPDIPLHPNSNETDKKNAKSYGEHKYVLGFTIKAMKAQTKYARP